MLGVFSLLCLNGYSVLNLNHCKSLLMKYCTPLIGLSLLLFCISCEEPVTNDLLDMSTSEDSQVITIDMRPEAGQEADEEVRTQACGGGR